MRLFHFSDDPQIVAFEPRAVRVPSVRPQGREWLNGPLVWAIDAEHAFTYLFPRDCPRIVVWATERSSAADREAWLGTARVVAYVETAWFERLKAATLMRYELAAESFESLDDAGMWVSRQCAAIIGREVITDLPAALEAAGVTLRVVDSLLPVRSVWQTSLHASGIRLRNAAGWTG